MRPARFAPLSREQLRRQHGAHMLHSCWAGMVWPGAHQHSDKDAGPGHARFMRPLQVVLTYCLFALMAVESIVVGG